MFADFWGYYVHRMIEIVPLKFGEILASLSGAVLFAQVATPDLGLPAAAEKAGTVFLVAPVLAWFMKTHTKTLNEFRMAQLKHTKEVLDLKHSTADLKTSTDKLEATAAAIGTAVEQGNKNVVAAIESLQSLPVRCPNAQPEAKKNPAD